MPDDPQNPAAPPLPPPPDAAMTAAPTAAMPMPAGPPPTRPGIPSAMPGFNPVMPMMPAAPMWPAMGATQSAAPQGFPGVPSAIAPGMPMPGMPMPGMPMPGMPMPGMMMPGMPAVAPQPAMPMQPAMPAMPAMPAPATTPAARVIIGDRDGYRFGEEPVAQRAQVSVLETPRVAADLPPPNKIDPNLEQLKVALEGQMARNAIAPMMYAPPNATRWFRFSPFELFLEQVLARKLWTLE